MPTPESAASTRPSAVDPVGLATIAGLLGVTDRPDSEVAVTGLSLGSSGVRPGDLYAALPGARTHGARYAADALQSGAVAVVTDAEGAQILDRPNVPVLIVERPRTMLGELAALIYGRPAEDLVLVGVTGTQGKTTTTQLISQAASQGRTTAVVGTMGTWIDGERVGSALTTPEAPDLHALFALMRERGVDLCAMEVSSHALVMGRVDGVVFDLALFTNLGRDHLDFHADMEEYFAAKAQLFTPTRATRALVNIDDEYGRRLADQPQIPTQTMSSTGLDADWRAAMDLAASSPRGSTFELSGPDGVSALASVAMPGLFNVANGLAAIAACVSVGVELDEAVRGVASSAPVTGRMEQVSTDVGFAVIVDYAHKPDALTAALQVLRPVTSGRLFLVIGAGGDRDRGKRPIMGEIAAQLADVLVVTDDNPRSEDPAAIRAEILAGAHREDSALEVVEIGDRRAAIGYALRSARVGDAILIAGKGHETGQEIAGTVLAFDDKAVAIEELHTLLPGRGGAS